MAGDDLVAWLRQRIRERRCLAERTIELGNAAVWEETATGVLVTGEPTETDTWHGTWPMGDSSLTRLMEANDPRDTIARCETELAILDFHDLAETWEQAEGKPLKQAEVLRIVVREIGRAYRHRPGYRQEWKP